MVDVNKFARPLPDELRLKDLPSEQQVRILCLYAAVQNIENYQGHEIVDRARRLENYILRG